VLEVYKTKKFDKDLRVMQKRGLNLNKLWDIVEAISLEKPLPIKNRNHKLSGEWKDFMECHIEPDWLLIYEIDSESLILARTGTHSDLF